MNQARLEILTEKLQDHCMSESECQELMEWLESDVSHMVAFAEQLRLSNALGTLRLIGCDGIAPAVMSSLAGVKGTSDLSRKVRLQIEKDKQSELLHHDNNVHFRKLATWLLATAATFFVIVGWLALRKDHELIDDGLVIARVTNQVNAVWTNDHVNNDGGIWAGLLELKSGFARLDFDNGASVTLQGPAAYELEGPMETRLHHGVLTARVPDSAVGFKVETVSLDVVDLGTAFGVSVSQKGVTDVSVFEGSVEVRPLSSPSSLLNAGEAIRSTGEAGKEFGSVAFDASPYERAWPIAFGVSLTTGALRFVRPGPPWDLTAQRDDDFIVVFPEAERIRLATAMSVDSIRPGELLREQQSEGSTIEAGTMVRSYLLQFNPDTKGSDERQLLSGEIIFSLPVVGIIWSSDRLAQTDTIFGSEESQYDFPGRGIEIPSIVRPEGAGRDRIFLSEDRRSLRLRLNCSVHLDQIRVLVEADRD